MTIYEGLPLYQGLVNDEDTGMFCISLVDMPATESDFMFFNKEKEPVLFAVQDAEKHLVRGLLMGADMPIYRRRGDFEYYITYSADTLRLMAEKYLKNGFSSNVDLNHDGNVVDGVNMTQIFVKDTEAGIDPKGFEMYKDGSLFVEFKVNNEEVWESIKEGDFKGFSLAGIFEIAETFNKDTNKKENKLFMKIEKIKAALRRILAEFGSVSTDKGVLVWDGDDELKEGDAVHGVDEEGNDVSVEDGEYRTEDGKIIVVEGGMVKEIRDDEAEVSSEPEAEEEGEPEAEPEAEQVNEESDEEPEAEEKEEDDKDKRIADLEAEIARLEEENGALKARIAELEGEPAADPASEEFKKTDEKSNSKVEALRKRGYKL